MSSLGVPDYPLYDNKPNEGANFGPFKNNCISSLPRFPFPLRTRLANSKQQKLISIAVGYAIKKYCSDMPIFAGKDMSNFRTGQVLK